MIMDLDDQPHDRQIFRITRLEKDSYVAKMLHAHQNVSLTAPFLKVRKAGRMLWRVSASAASNLMAKPRVVRDV